MRQLSLRHGRRRHHSTKPFKEEWPDGYDPHPRRTPARGHGRPARLIPRRPPLRRTQAPPVPLHRPGHASRSSPGTCSTCSSPPTPATSWAPSCSATSTWPWSWASASSSSTFGIAVGLLPLRGPQIRPAGDRAARRHPLWRGPLMDILAQAESTGRTLTMVLFLVTVAVTIGITIWGHRYTRTATDFHSGGRGFSAWQNGFAIAVRLHVGGLVPRHRRDDRPVRLRRVPLLDRLPRRMARGAPAGRRDAPQHRPIHHGRRRSRSGCASGRSAPPPPSRP